MRGGRRARTHSCRPFNWPLNVPMANISRRRRRARVRCIFFLRTLFSLVAVGTPPVITVRADASNVARVAPNNGRQSVNFPPTPRDINGRQFFDEQFFFYPVFRTPIAVPRFPIYGLSTAAAGNIPLGYVPFFTLRETLLTEAFSCFAINDGDSLAPEVTVFRASGVV